VLFEAWKTERNMFKELVMHEIQLAINEDRPEFLTEIIVTKMHMEGDPP
jgi:hypothetical protein